MTADRRSGVNRRGKAAAPPPANQQPSLAMDVRQLRYFVGVAEQLHFGRAAEQMNVSQPSLSRQVRQLERQLGVQLLTRDKPTVHLTAAGATLLEEARQIIAMTQRAQAIVRTVGSKASGELRIGFLPALNWLVNSAVLREMAARHPAVAFSLVHMSSAEQMLALRYEQLDIALVWEVVGGRELEAGFERLELFEDAPGIVVSRSNPLAAMERVAMADLARQRPLLFDRAEHTELYDALAQVLKAAGCREPAVVHSSGLPGMVAADLGVAFGSMHLPPEAMTGLVVKPLDLSSPRLRASYVWRRFNSTATQQGFLDIARNLRDRGRWSLPEVAAKAL